MKLNNWVFVNVNKWAQSPYALYLLIAISFLQPFCLPIAVDFLFVAMMIAKPRKAIFYFLVVVLATFAGGICGYLLGRYAFDVVFIPLITKLGYSSSLNTAFSLFDKYGAFILVLSGIIPLPYMLFPTISGILKLDFIRFILASFIGRFLRYLVVLILFKTGHHLKSYYRQ